MEQEELQAIYGCLWDKWLPGLYRFALFLTNDPSQAQTYLEQVFLNCWNSGAFRKCLKEKGNTARMMFYRELWRRWSGFSGTDGEEVARLYLQYVQHFEEAQARKIIKG